MEDKYQKNEGDQLGDLLKRVDLQEPSDQFSDKVLNAYTLQKNRRTFRLIKVPLFLMGILASLMLLPWIMSMIMIIPETPKPQLSYLIQGLTFDFSIWYLLAPLTLILGLMAVILIEIRSNFYHKKNTPVL